MYKLKQIKRTKVQTNRNRKLLIAKFAQFVVSAIFLSHSIPWMIKHTQHFPLLNLTQSSNQSTELMSNLRLSLTVVLIYRIAVITNIYDYLSPFLIFQTKYVTINFKASEEYFKQTNTIFFKSSLLLYHRNRYIVCNY